MGVERTFPVHSPSLDKIELVTRGRVRRAKLYYLRSLRGKAARIKERREPVGALGDAHRLLGRSGSGRDERRRRGTGCAAGSRRPAAACHDSLAGAHQGHPARPAPALGSDPMMNDDQDGRERALTEAGGPRTVIATRGPGLASGSELTGGAHGRSGRPG